MVTNLHCIIFDSFEWKVAVKLPTSNYRYVSLISSWHHFPLIRRRRRSKIEKRVCYNWEGKNCSDGPLLYRCLCDFFIYVTPQMIALLYFRCRGFQGHGKFLFLLISVDNVIEVIRNCNVDRIVSRWGPVRVWFMDVIVPYTASIKDGVTKQLSFC